MAFKVMRQWRNGYEGLLPNQGQPAGEGSNPPMYSSNTKSNELTYFLTEVLPHPVIKLTINKLTRNC